MSRGTQNIKLVIYESVSVSLSMTRWRGKEWFVFCKISVSAMIIEKCNLGSSGAGEEECLSKGTPKDKCRGMLLTLEPNFSGFPRSMQDCWYRGRRRSAQVRTNGAMLGMNGEAFAQVVMYDNDQPALSSSEFPDFSAKLEARKVACRQFSIVVL